MTTGLTVRDQIPVGTRFSARLDRLWGPTTGGGQPYAPAASTPGKSPVPTAQEDGWTAGSVWRGGKSRPHQDSIPDLPARSTVAIPTVLPGPL